MGFKLVAAKKLMGYLPVSGQENEDANSSGDGDWGAAQPFGKSEGTVSSTLRLEQPLNKQSRRGH